MACNDTFCVSRSHEDYTVLCSKHPRQTCPENRNSILMHRVTTGIHSARHQKRSHVGGPLAHHIHHIHLSVSGNGGKMSARSTCVLIFAWFLLTTYVPISVLAESSFAIGLRTSTSMAANRMTLTAAYQTKVPLIAFELQNTGCSH